MKTIIHRAESRGFANHGWLQANHSFSFASYHNPERMHFGALRVLNDDVVAAKMGFGTHPHDNMEIITIPFEGDLQHKDSMGNSEIIKEGDIQVMSAGKGVLHSEFNPNTDKKVQLFQIWIFPNKKDVEPRYDQISIRNLEKQNEFYQILSPYKEDQGVWIHQNAWFHMGNFNKETTLSYHLKDTQNGVYIIMIDGNSEIMGQELNKRDGFGVWDTESIEIKATKNSKMLLIEVPMSL